MHWVHQFPGARRKMPELREGSPLRSPRDEQDLRRQYRITQKQHDPINWVSEWCRQLEWQLRKIRIHMGSSGTNGSPAKQYMCQITEVFGDKDYIGVTAYDGTDLSGNQFLCAKADPSKLNFGDADSYTVTDDNNRVSHISGLNDETQVVYPLFQVGDTVWVERCDHTGVLDTDGNELEYREDNTFRAWGAPTETTVLSGYNVLIMVPP